MENLKDFANKHEKQFAIFGILISIVIFAILCATQVSRWSVWFDESFTHYLIKFNFFDIAKWTAMDVHPPLFYWLLKAWGMIFGTSDVALRSMSILFGSGAIVLGFLLARKLFGKRAGYLALPLIVLSPMLIRYGIEMRMYALVTVIVLAQFLTLIKARETSRKAWWTTYGVLLAVGMWTQYFSAFAVIAQWIWLVLDARSSGFRGKKMWRNVFGFREKVTRKNFWPQIFAKNSAGFLWSLFVAAILFSPWIMTMFHQLITVTASGFWIPPVGMNTLPDLLSTTFLYQLSSYVTGWLLILMLAIFAIFAKIIWDLYRNKALARDKKFRENMSLILCGIIAPPLVMIAISLPPLRSAFIDRYVLASLLLISILIAGMVSKYFDLKSNFHEKIEKLHAEFRSRVRENWSRFKWPIALYILVLVAFVIGFVNLTYWGNYNKQTGSTDTIKNLMSQVSRNSGSRKIAVIADSAWSFYDSDVYASAKNPVYFLNSQVDNYYYGSEKMLAGAPEEIANLSSWISRNDVHEVWYISSSDNEINPPKELGSSAKNWHKVSEIKSIAPNNWSGSSEAILYQIK